MQKGCEVVLKKRFIINGILLTATTLITRTIGIFFRVYMSNSIGAEALGLYQLIITLYFFAVTFATSGITLVVTRLVTDSLALNNVNKARSITGKCLGISLFLSLLSGAVIFFCADFLGGTILGDSRTILSLRVLAPSLPFMSVSACFRGYFYARRTVIKTAGEQLLEQLVEIGVFAAIAGTMAPMGLEYACCAVAIGTTISEIITCFYSYALFKIDIRKMKAKKEKLNNFTANVLSIGIPVTLSACLRAGLSMIENIMIPRGLKKQGNSYDKSLSDYGQITGMVMPVITFPAVFLMAFSTLIIPEVSEAKSINRLNSVKHMTLKTINTAFLFSIPIAVVLFFFSADLGNAIYGNNDSGRYICFLAPLVPLLYLDSVTDGLLKGLNEQLHYLSYNIIDSVVRVILIVILLPRFGIAGLISVMYISGALNTGLSLMRLLKVTDIEIKVIKRIICPIIFTVISCIISKFLFSPLPHTALMLIGAIITSLLLYITLMLVTKALGKEDVIWFKSFFKVKG